MNRIQKAMKAWWKIETYQKMRKVEWSREKKKKKKKKMCIKKNELKKKKIKKITQQEMNHEIYTIHDISKE